MKTLPKLYLSGGFWCIAPFGNRRHTSNIIASKTFDGACAIAKQCYNPRR